MGMLKMKKNNRVKIVQVPKSYIQNKLGALI